MVATAGRVDGAEGEGIKGRLEILPALFTSDGYRTRKEGVHVKYLTKMSPRRCK